ncbi:MAG: hypothetical protein ACREMY_00630 [bacterium]
MARKTGKRRGSPEQVATADAEELKVGDIPVSQLMKFLGVPAPEEARAAQGPRAVARPLINPEAKVVDLTVGELLQLLATGHW